MSAWLCSAEHIGQIVKYSGGMKGLNLSTKEKFDYDREELAVKLATENIRSLIYRYPETWRSFVGNEVGYLAECKEKSKGMLDVSKKDLVGLVRSYRYQACEHEGWIDSDAYWITQYVLNDLYAELIETSMWDYNGREETYV